MSLITYRVRFNDSGIGTRTGRALSFSLSGKELIFAIQCRTPHQPHRYLVHVASGQVVSPKTIDDVMRDSDCSETEAARIIFEEMRKAKGDKKMLSGIESCTVINPSIRYAGHSPQIAASR